VASVRRRWQWLLDNLDLPLAEAEPQFADYGVQAGELSNRAANPRLFHRLQDYSVRTSWKTELKARLDKIFDGQLFGPVRDELKKLHKQVLRGRVFVALHMHAGDGNVHTNIPVNSDNYEMLQTANHAVDRIMALARSLDGVISGEHGIGITKLDYLTDAEMANYWAYKQKVDRKAASTAAS
jgi:FAD/FMN-containing dehydrogenase